jgi:MYXO-CTERM domain-containing protein
VAVPAAVSIPEPASVMMGLMGALGLVARRRRSL